MWNASRRVTDTPISMKTVVYASPAVVVAQVHTCPSAVVVAVVAESPSFLAAVADTGTHRALDDAQTERSTALLDPEADLTNSASALMEGAAATPWPLKGYSLIRCFGMETELV